MSENNSGKGCYELSHYIIFGGLGGLMLIVCLGGVFLQGAWEVGETHNVQPEQVAQATVSTASSPVGAFVLALIAVGMVGILILKAVASIGR